MGKAKKSIESDDDDDAMGKCLLPLDGKGRKTAVVSRKSERARKRNRKLSARVASAPFSFDIVARNENMRRARRR